MLDPNCISPARIADLAAHPSDPRLDSADADAHLSSCPSCRSQFRASLNQESREPETAADLFLDDSVSPCLDDEECLRFVRKQMDAFEREGAALHIADCGTCRAIVLDLEEFEGELAMDRPSRFQESVTGLQAAGRRLKEAGASWLQEMGGQISAARQSLRPAAANYAFSTGTGESGRQKLDFGEDGDFSGSYRIRNGVCDLHIETASSPPGTLALLEASDASRQVVWRRFLVFRRGMRRAVIDLTTGGDLELHFLSIGVAAVSRLPDEAAAELSASYLAAGNDPAVQAAWAAWAEDASASTLSPAVRNVIDSIRAGSGA